LGLGVVLGCLLPCLGGPAPRLSRGNRPPPPPTPLGLRASLGLLPSLLGLLGGRIGVLPKKCVYLYHCSSSSSRSVMLSHPSAVRIRHVERSCPDPWRTRRPGAIVAHHRQWWACPGPGTTCPRHRCGSSQTSGRGTRRPSSRTAS